jgi:DedD protein
MDKTGTRQMKEMPRMNDADDVQLQLKKKARRRLVGAIAFAAFAALALPLVMDGEPRMSEQEVEIRIPSPNTAEALPADGVAPVAPAIPPEPAAPEAAAAPSVSVISVTPAAQPARPAQNTPPPPSPAAAPPRAAPDPAAEAEARRAANILSGKSPEGATLASAANVGADAPHVILIGAFANAANVENLKKKLQELKIPVYTEALDSPQGVKKTRVRAGPFKNRAAADAALDKMRRTGVKDCQDCKVVPQS